MPSLQDLHSRGDDYRGVVIRNVFEDAYNYMKSGQLTRQVINKLQDGIETNFPQAFRTRETADLFMTLFIHLLKDGGRAAVVLPDGFLFGEGMKTRFKEKLLTECNLHTIVRLPNGVFNPYTGIKINLLFFTKGTPTEVVWFYEHPYPGGVNNYSKTRPMKVEEFQTEIDWWGKEADGFTTR